jgi:hypothetical protein
MKTGSILLGIVLTTSTLFAQVKSPAEFLGYELGAKHTPAHLVQRYFEYIAQVAQDKVTLQTYGKTNEGRPLLLAIITSATNKKNLETIRKNNLQLVYKNATVAPDQLAQQPVLVWLSYNVHGNEASSTEAAMQTMYELVRDGSTCTSWLNNTVVLIDPCINPDGRDRYVNWYQSVVGEQFNPLPIAREHQEPWPGGRSNHYYFDLNRDWAWLTQVESVQRISLYRNWMPQVHVDFHEQGYNEPYYFAPAAEPYHEIITNWQRQFQQEIGKNHAQYFDKNGWLFFTKERFDLLYPSYGDTYPIYNGAIGMTYEQGGIRAGLGIINEEGDTLTLRARIAHHLTTSLSTIELSAQQQKKLVSEFNLYFENATTKGAGTYKSFVLKAGATQHGNVQQLLKLLDAHGIQYGVGASAQTKGVNNFSGKEETFTVNREDIIISGLQPNSALVQVLFEPKTTLVDSATYDITAWALPYAYGLQAFACKDKLIGTESWKKPVVSIASTTYGYALPWNSLQSASFAARLLKAGYKLRYAEASFVANGKQFDPGTLLLLKTSNERFGERIFDRVRDWALQEQVNLVPLHSGLVEQGADFGSDKVHPIRAPRVALLSGEGISSLNVGEVWHFFDRQLFYPISMLSVNSFSVADLQAFDVLVLPEGKFKFLDSKDAVEGIRQWIQQGGKLIALGESTLQLTKLDLGLINRKTEATAESAPVVSSFKNRERDEIRSSTTGSIWRVTLDTSHPLAFGYPANYFTLKTDPTIFEYLKKENGWNVGVLKNENALAGFVGSLLAPKLKEGVLIGQLPLGHGAVTFFADNLLFRNFWQNGKLMFCNALFFEAQ